MTLILCLILPVAWVSTILWKVCMYKILQVSVVLLHSNMIISYSTRLYSLPSPPYDDRLVTRPPSNTDPIELEG